MIIDAHTHIEFKGNTAKDLLASMNDAEIDYALLIASSAPLPDNGPTTEQVIEICEKHPCLKAIGCIEYKHISTEQIDKLINYLKEEKIYGIKLYPGYEDFYPYDEKLFPLYEKCQNLGKPIIFHTGLLEDGLPGKLKQSHPLNIDEVANKFPTLNIVMAHFGNPWIIDATMVARKNRNVYVDLSGYFGSGHVPEEHIQFFKQDLAYFKGFVGSYKKCLFGSDWPPYLQKAYVEAVKQLPLTDEEKELVFWKNANELFQLNVKPSSAQ